MVNKKNKEIEKMLDELYKLLEIAAWANIEFIKIFNTFRDCISVKLEGKEKIIVERDAKNELDNVIAHVSSFFDMPIDNIYDMTVESLLEYVREMCR